MKYALLIDGDNINPSYLPSVIKYVESTGSELSSINLFGKLNSGYLDDWNQAYPKGSVITKYNITENRKNSTDMRILSEAIRMYYEESIKHFIILSSDQDMESIIYALPADVEIVIGYCRHKTSKPYLKALSRKRIRTMDLDAIRGDLTPEQIKETINSALRCYLGFKLGASYFSYTALAEWISDRYPELKDLKESEIVDALSDVKLTFTKEGCHVLKI